METQISTYQQRTHTSRVRGISLHYTGWGLQTNDRKVRYKEREIGNRDTMGGERSDRNSGVTETVEEVEIIQVEGIETIQAGKEMTWRITKRMGTVERYTFAEGGARNVSNWFHLGLQGNQWFGFSSLILFCGVWN